MESKNQDFSEIKTRLDDIVEAVSNDNISLDDALSLYEEAVSLGLTASSLLEQGVLDQASQSPDEANSPQEDDSQAEAAQ